MHRLQGKPVSSGYGEGRAFVLDPKHFDVARHAIDAGSIRSEQERFRTALSGATKELERLQGRVATDLGEEGAEVFAAHVAFLKDRQFIQRIEERIERDRVNAEQAVERTVAVLSATLAAVQDEYLREREQDVRDLGRWILRQLARLTRSPLAVLPPRSVLVAHELLPSDLLQVDRPHVTGIVTEIGGEVSHVAILARALGVPYVTGVKGAVSEIPEGATLLVNGDSGQVWIEPDAGERVRFSRSKATYDQISAQAAASEDRACLTLDGVPITLLANIGRPEDTIEVVQHRLDGVGLFRTEFLFLDQHEPPSLQQQYDAYCMVVDVLDERPLVIRTLDLGGDKKPAFFMHHFENNPSLGVRGLRFALSAALELFRTQLRAIVRLSRPDSVRVLFPLVLGGYDLQRAKHELEQICSEEGVSAIPKVGAMIETPSAVLMIEEIVTHADFLSIGTNDLTQFILAADRNALDAIDDYTPLHPAVLRAIRRVIEAAARRSLLVSICGEAAADPATAALFVGLGVRSLSMSPYSAARVRQLLRNVSCMQLTRLADAALAASDPYQVARLVAEELAGVALMH